jgi:hypothetical protein
LCVLTVLCIVPTHLEHSPEMSQNPRIFFFFLFLFFCLLLSKYVTLTMMIRLMSFDCPRVSAARYTPTLFWGSHYPAIRLCSTKRYIQIVHSYYNDFPHVKFLPLFPAIKILWQPCMLAIRSRGEAYLVRYSVVTIHWYIND